MQNRIQRLERLAREALDNYRHEIRTGEPVFPQWADDLQQLLAHVEAIGAGGVSMTTNRAVTEYHEHVIAMQRREIQRLKSAGKSK